MKTASQVFQQPNQYYVYSVWHKSQNSIKKRQKPVALSQDTTSI